MGARTEVEIPVQVVGVEQERDEAGGAGTGHVVAEAVADVPRLLGGDASSSHHLQGWSEHRRVGLLDADHTGVDHHVDRHAPTRSDVWVVAQAGDEVVRVEVSDRGKGVEEDARQRIFEPFQRGEGSRSTGIGLAICKAIVTAHGGEILVERTFGGGATFAFTLPVHIGSVPE